MADISSVILLDGNSYDLKDAAARTLLGGHSVGIDVPSNAVFTDTGMYIASYGSSTYAEVLAAYQANRIIYCRASSNSNPASGNQLRMAFLAYVNNQTTPTEFEFQYYRSVATHSDSTQGDEVYVYKLKQASGWEFTKRNAFTKIAAGTGLSSSYSSGTLTLANSQTAYTSTPADLGTASAGDSTSWAKGDHVHKMPTAADVGAANAADVKIKSYTSVADLGQAIRTATISSTWAALPTDSMLAADSGEFAYGECPGSGYVLMIKSSAGSKSSIIFYGVGEAVGDYRMWITGTAPYAPTGTWQKLPISADIPAASSTTPSADTTDGAVGTGTTWARADHTHPINVATSGTPSALGTAALGTSSKYARHDHVHAMPTAANVGAVSINDVKFKIYDSVTDIGFTAGANATTIKAVYNAMPNSSILITSEVEFPSGQFPSSTGGAVEIVKRTAARGYVNYYGKEAKHADYRMFLSSDSEPSEIWNNVASVVNTTNTASNIATAGSNCSITTAEFAQYGKMAQLRLTIKATATLAAANKTVATIVSGKRPIYNAIVGCHTSHDLVGYINASGAVIINGAVSNDTSFTVYSTYILA